MKKYFTKKKMKRILGHIIFSPLMILPWTLFAILWTVNKIHKFCYGHNIRISLR